MPKLHAKHVKTMDKFLFFQLLIDITLKQQEIKFQIHGVLKIKQDKMM